MPQFSRGMSDVDLIIKARYLVGLRESLTFQRAILLKKKEMLVQWDKQSKQQGGKARWQPEIYALQSHAYVMQVTINETSAERQIAIAELIARGLCDKLNYLEFLGVMHHDN